MKRIEPKDHSFTIQTSPGGQTLEIKNKKTQEIAKLVLSASNFKPELSFIQKLWNATIGTVLNKHKWIPITDSSQKTFFVYKKAIDSLKFKNY
jgi:hypothetical protein